MKPRSQIKILTYISKDLIILSFDYRWQRRAKLVSRLWHDRPMSPMESAVYWTEYVARYQGAPNLQPGAPKAPFYQQLQLDVLAFIGLVLYILSYVVCKILSVICCCCCQKQPQAEFVEETRSSKRVKFE